MPFVGCFRPPIPGPRDGVDPWLILLVMDRTSQGFTLIELLVTITIVAVLAVVAVPSFRSVIQRNSVTNDSNLLLSLLTLTRSEAIKRNQQVVMCKTRRTNEDNMLCLGGADWKEGVLVFVDNDRDAAFSSGDEIVRLAVPLTGSTDIAAESNIDSGVGYTGTGLLSVPDTLSVASAASAFTVTSGSESAQVSISPTGRPRVETD